MKKGRGRTYRGFEQIAKGFANHRRIQIMDTLEQNPELSVDDISHKLSVNYKTISEHTRRLLLSGMVIKRNEGNAVRHKLTKRGLSVLKFLRTLE